MLIMKLISRLDSNWSAQRLSNEISQKFVNSNTLVLDETYVYEYKDFLIIENFLKRDIKNKVICISLIDPDTIKARIKTYKNIDINRITFINTSHICLWLLAVDKFFLPYSIEDVTPKQLTYKFLCYQRKSFDERKLLYEGLKDKDGIVTIGTSYFDNINKELPNHKGYTEELPVLSNVKNDIWSLGNIDIWNKCFLNIVSETVQNLNFAVPFVSEKIFKPIIGLRPFICYGHPNTNKLLKKLGFEIFEDEFNYKPTIDYRNNVKQIVDLIDNIDIGMYNKLLPKLLHNKNWLKHAAINEWQKIEELVKETIC